jgi:hypothetical protein
MPTPYGVNYLLLFLIDFFQFPNCPKQESKSGRSVLCPYVCCYVTIRSYTLKGETLISRAKIVIISEKYNDIVEKVKR